MLGRSDLAHVLYALPAALVLCGGAVESFARAGFRRVSRLSGIAVLMLFLIFPIREALPAAADFRRLRELSLRGRDGRISQERRETVEFVQQHTTPGEPIFVGNDQHRRVIWNDVSLYYLADRVSATRYLQFDPGLVTREAVQREIVGDLAAKNVRIIVVMKGGHWYEPNESRAEGSPLLDQYLHAHYEVVGGAGGYVWLRRREGLQ